MTPYDLLGLPPDADDETIAMAFREAAKRWHPDLNPNDPEAERQFKQISAARDALLNPAWRALYRYLQVRRQHDRRLWIGTIRLRPGRRWACQFLAETADARPAVIGRNAEL
jgi:hypothetical protein